MNRSKGFILCGWVYCISFLVAFLSTYSSLGLHQWISISIGHIAATLCIFIFSVYHKNSSLYDPFWSVAPLPIALYLAFWPVSGEVNSEKIFLVLVPITYWSFRLTINWIRQWEGLGHEDFRYIDLKNKFNKNPYIIDFTGIHIYPTLQVNISLFPIYFILSVSTVKPNLFLYLSSIFTILSVVLEHVADEQMKKFKKDPSNSAKTMQTGLWKYSRHPNYLGEALFWWGLYLMVLSLDHNYWWLIICPLSMTLMFTLATCSMMDNRSLEKRSDYADYMKKTSQLMLWPPKS